MTTKLRNVKVNEISLVKRGANNKRIYLTKSEETQMEDMKTPETIALEKAQADLKAATDRAEALEKSQVEALAKLTAEKAELEKAQKEAVTKTEELQKALDAEKDAKEVSESIQKAATDFKNLPEKPEAVGPLLRKIRKADPATADAVEALLKKVDAVAKLALDSKGTAATVAGDVSAWDEIQKRAKALVAAKVVTSIAKGVDKAMKDDQELYAKYEAEKTASAQR